MLLGTSGKGAQQLTLQDNPRKRAIKTTARPSRLMVARGATARLIPLSKPVLAHHEVVTEVDGWAE